MKKYNIKQVFTSPLLYLSVLALPAGCPGSNKNNTSTTATSTTSASAAKQAEDYANNASEIIKKTEEKLQEINKLRIVSSGGETTPAKVTTDEEKEALNKMEKAEKALNKAVTTLKKLEMQTQTQEVEEVLKAKIEALKAQIEALKAIEAWETLKKGRGDGNAGSGLG